MINNIAEFFCGIDAFMISQANALCSSLMASVAWIEGDEWSRNHNDNVVKINVVLSLRGNAP